MMFPPMPPQELGFPYLFVAAYALVMAIGIFSIGKTR
jgi:hypothetical protein